MVSFILQNKHSNFQMGKKKISKGKEVENITGQSKGTGSGGLERLLEKPQKKILFAGVGNVLKKDDGAGVYIVQKILEGNGIGGLVVEMGIENYIGKINTLAPDDLVIIDACDFGKEPGFWWLSIFTDIKDLTTNTHNISLAKLSELFNMPVYILGIQPADVSFGEGMGREVKKAAKQIIQMINSKSVDLIMPEQPCPDKSVVQKVQ